jgi:phage repressor protein C with HTH and peptisase S24 domain
MLWIHMPKTPPQTAPHDWLRETREDLELTQTDIKDKAALHGLKFTQSYLSKIERGEHPLEKVDGQKLEFLRRTYKVSHLQWEARTGVPIKPEDRRLPFDQHSSAPPLILEPNARELTDYIIRPIEPLSAAAGTPEIIETQHSDVYIMPRVDFRQTYRFFTADGDSMVLSDGNGIHHGDTLIVDTARLDPREGEVFVVQDATGAVVVKRARVWNDEWWLASDNPRYPPFQLDEARVLGMVMDAEGKRNFRRMT